MKHNWIACWLSPDLEGWHCSECEDYCIEPEYLGVLECSGYIGVERDCSKVLNSGTFSFREWFDNLFPNVKNYTLSPFYAITHPHKTISLFFNEIKYAYQRVFRGWDDRVAWGVGFWMSDIMPDILRQSLKNAESGGIPIDFFEGVPDENGNYTEAEEALAVLKMRSVYLELISAFEEMKELEDYKYDFKNKSREQVLKEYNDKIHSTKERMKKLIDYYHDLGD